MAKMVTFACCFLLSKLNLTLVAFSSLILEYSLREHDCGRAVSDPCVHFMRNKGESEKEEGVEIVHFLLMITIGLCNRSRSLLTAVSLGHFSPNVYLK